MGVRRSLATGAGLLALLGATLATAAPAQAAPPVPRADLLARVSDPINALPSRAELHVVQSDGGAITQDYTVRMDRAAKRLHMHMKMLAADETYYDVYQGYDGTREYLSPPPGALDAPHVRALELAGKPGPYFAAQPPGPPPAGMFDGVSSMIPAEVAKAAVTAVADDKIERVELPSGALLFQLRDLPGGAARVDVRVERNGKISKTWRYESSSYVAKSELVASGAAVNTAMPKGSLITESIYNAAWAAYPRNAALAKLTPKAAALAKKVNKRAKKKRVAVSAKVIKKWVGKPIAGFTVSKVAKGVKVVRAYPAASPPETTPAGTVARCVVAKGKGAKAKAVVKNC